MSDTADTPEEKPEITPAQAFQSFSISVETFEKSISVYSKAFAWLA